MTQSIIPEGSGWRIERRRFAAVLSLPLVLVLGTVALVALWALLTLSMIFALLACAALVAIGLPICFFLARRSWRRFADNRGAAVKMKEPRI